MSTQLKQVIVMRNDLNMRKGKMVAQGAHAAMQVITTKYVVKLEHYAYNLNDNVVMHWLASGMTKICVKVNSLEELEGIVAEARDAGIPAHILTDLGLTEFDGEPTITCAALGPHNAHELDEITGHLQLL